MRILVTGGAGYIGSVLVPALLADGHAVTVVDNMLYRQNSLLDCCYYETFRAVRGDVRDESLMRGLLAKADAIIPLAALVGAPLCNRDKFAAETTNRDAVRLICKLASPSQWILMPATNSGYGVGAGELLTEDTPLHPVSVYGVTKAQAEAAVLERENSVTFRLATNFGLAPRMRLDLLVNDFVYRAVTDRAVVVFEGHFRRNYLHVRDTIRVFQHGLAHFDCLRGRAYNAGLDDANLSKLELCAEIKKQLPLFAYLEAPIGEDPDKRDYIISNARLAATGFQPKWTLEQGIRELIKAYTLLSNSRFGNA